MKKTFIILCCACCFLMGFHLIHARAQDGDQGALSYDELMEWAQPYWERLKNIAPVNAPVGEESLTEDGYMHIYPFATLYSDSPSLDDFKTLRAITVFSENEELPRGLHTETSLETLLNTFYHENESLNGTRDSAYLYLSNTMPMGAMWGRAERNGQQVQTVQFAVHEQLSSSADGYSDCGILFTLEQNTVVIMSAYGLNNTLSELDVLNQIALIDRLAHERSYFMYPRSADGNGVDPLDREDLFMPGFDFLTASPEDCTVYFGIPDEDVWMDDGDGFLRILDYKDVSFIFSFDSQRHEGRLLCAEIIGPGIDGPRGAAIGEPYIDVYRRFAHSRVPYDGTATERLYGETGSLDYGVAEYDDDGVTTLRYVLDTGLSDPVTLQMRFEWNKLMNIMIYCW